MYDELVPLNKKNDYVEGQIDPSTIHHFYHKLLKHVDYMNTQTAKGLANEKTDFMRKFAEEFINEWKGKYE